jgi:endoglucanase
MNYTNTNRTNGNPDTAAHSSRRDFLKATAGASALAAGIGSGFVGSVAADIPTPRLTVDDNLIKDPQGNPVKLRGLNIADPKRINITAPARGKTTEQVIDMITNEKEGWYPRVIRVPVQPVDIGEHPPGPVAEGDPAPPVPAFDQSQLESYLETHLDPVVQQCKEKNVYCIVDYHRHWKGVQWGSMNSGINTKLQSAVLDFWKTVAPRYGDMNHVFFEIYNEPTKPGMYGPRDRQWVHDIWNDWKKMAQPWVNEIRQHSANLIIIGSPGWSQTPEGASMISEFDGKNLSYTYHTYGGHAANRTNSWEEQGGHDYSGMQGAYEEVPVFATEFGWQDNFPGYGYHRWIQGTTDGFGAPLIDVFESHPGIHWTAWCADPIWLPAMFKRGFDAPDTTDSIGNPYEEEVPTHCENLPCDWKLRGGQDMGVYVKETLAKKRNDGIPTGSTGSGDTIDPTMPTNLTVTSTTASSITVTWNASTDSGGSGLDQYVIAADDQQITVPAGTTRATLTGLSPGTSYDISVSAIDSAGNRSSVARVTGTTDGDSETSPGDPTQTVRLRAESVSTGGITTASITLSNAPKGLSGYWLTVSVEDTSVATIENATVSSVLVAPSGKPDIVDDGSSVSLRAADRKKNVQSGAENVELATVALKGHSEGQTKIAVAVGAIDNDNGNAMSVKTTGAMLSVISGTDIEPIIEGEMPTDVDTDGDYEDLNGNNRGDFDDVVLYFNHMNEPVITGHTVYDYNANGEIDFADVVSLFQEVQ